MLYRMEKPVGLLNLLFMFLIPFFFLANTVKSLLYGFYYKEVQCCILVRFPSVRCRLEEYI